MEIRTVGLMSPGDMGSGIARALAGSGRRVVTALEGRSERTCSLAKSAGIEDVGGLGDLVATVDVVLSVMPPAAAPAFAEATAAAMRERRATPLFADLNAISPETSATIARTIEATGAAYVDGGIIGLSPGKGVPPRVYVSGREAERLLELATPTMRVEHLGLEAGRASALKMVYSALNKGTWALQAATLIAAERLGLSDELATELESNQKAVWERMQQWIGFLAADAERWHPEMVEIAQTLESVGVTPRFHEGAEDLFRLLAKSPLAAETRETWDRDRSLADSIRIYAATLDARRADGEAAE